MTVIIGITVIGFCMFFCSMSIYSVFDGTFGSMGGMIILLLVPYAAFIALGYCRYLLFTKNPSEAWGALACIFSAFSLCASAAIVSSLEGTFYPEVVAYRSINLEGYRFLYALIYMPLLTVWFWSIHQWVLRFFSASAKDSIQTDVKRRPLLPFIKRYWKYDLCVTLLFCIVLTVSSFSMLALSPPLPLTEEHLSYEEFYHNNRFPSDGSDFCYKRFNSGLECDFKLSEESYLRWVKAHEDWNAKEISPDNHIEIDQPYPNEPIRIINGVVAENKRNEEYNTFEKAVFDREKSRVYYAFYIL